MKINFYRAGYGQCDVNIPNALVRETLLFLLEKDHWKWDAELLHERMLRLRKRMMDEATFTPVPAVPAA